MNLVVNSLEILAESIFQGKKNHLPRSIKGFHKYYPVTVVRAQETFYLFLYGYYLGLYLRAPTRFAESPVA